MSDEFLTTPMSFKDSGYIEENFFLLHSSYKIFLIYFRLSTLKFVSMSAELRRQSYGSLHVLNLLDQGHLISQQNIYCLCLVNRRSILPMPGIFVIIYMNFQKPSLDPCQAAPAGGWVSCFR
jgi:hypothetical protein